MLLHLSTEEAHYLESYYPRLAYQFEQLPESIEFNGSAENANFAIYLRPSCMDPSMGALVGVMEPNNILVLNILALSWIIDETSSSKPNQNDRMLHDVGFAGPLGDCHRVCGLPIMDSWYLR